MSNKDIFIEQLIEKDIFKLPDGRDLYEGTEEELMMLLEEMV
ncbi:Fur-regulated basic protein FbpA [Bacillus thuringiensis]|nr:Fur-regulated basic protein FbpA [Bacillus thuringiensis]MED2760016.1 Fur-regulated basic protein FbpA [Bacillus thuringiensis]MED2769510.1 Fur-regulated basic protein FbpA [Bacillus thuringiensis]MED2777718.1 Fur-regulated basic protein FbpA [Bacillus thuringiensis]MED2780582.1 Fur-regulated basic protein FbpA [Bacillus thuringiensis]